MDRLDEVGESEDVMHAARIRVLCWPRESESTFGVVYEDASKRDAMVRRIVEMRGEKPLAIGDLPLSAVGDEQARDLHGSMRIHGGVFLVTELSGLMCGHRAQGDSRRHRYED